MQQKTAHKTQAYYMAGYSISNNNCYMISRSPDPDLRTESQGKGAFQKAAEHFATCTSRITGCNFKMTANYHSFPSSPKQAARAHLLHHMSATKTKMQDKLFHVSATKIKDKLNSKVADM